MNTLFKHMQMGALALVCGVATIASSAADAAQQRAINRGVSAVVHSDISPPLRDMTPLPVPDLRLTPQREMEDDFESDLMQPFGFQDYDMSTDTTIYPPRIPAPLTSFNGQPNISGVAPPDSVGDVGPNHYVAMSNLSFQIFTKTGTSVFGPALTNTLWAGFGGPCQTENAGDPVVLHDQLANRWLLMQFTSAGPVWYICLALSTGPDPTSTYQRYQISTGGNFPDYPKMSVWPDGYYVSTREFLGSGGPFQGAGAYAMNRTQMLAGNLSPTVISMLATPTPAYNVGDGLLPADIDGFTLPPAGSPAYFMGSMDDGGPYGATQDALTLWKFTANFTTPASSTFVLANTIPIAPYDTIYPCPGGGRSCIPQSGTTNNLDIQSYRQRPLHRLAYRNFGGYQSLVTNQSVEAPGPFAGVRWWEIRSPNVTPVIFQQGTYAPADGLHRWMGSAAMDSAGNMALGYSTSSATTFPSLAYTGRLAGDPLNTMPQGEQVIHTGTGSQTGGGNRWGDYSSLNVDPTDDCTFWFVSEYLPTTSASGWQLRIGSFRFNECGTPGFALGVTPASQAICAGTPAVYTVTNSAIASFAGPVTLALAGAPAPATGAFSPNPVPTPGSSTLTISNTAGVASGTYPLTVNGTATGADPRMAMTQLVVSAGVPTAPTLTTPANASIGQPVRPTFQWSNTGAATYTIQVATDVAFTNIVFTATQAGTSVTPAADLGSDTIHYWRVRGDNACGPGAFSSVFSFRTVTAPGACSAGTTARNLFSEDFSNGIGGFTTTGSSGASTWAISGVRPSPLSGGNAMLAVDLATVADQRLISPAINLPTGQLPLTLRFQNYRDIEQNGASACYDGAILEVSVNGGSFAQATGAQLLNDPYRGNTTGTSNPLNGQQAWCNSSTASAPRPYADTLIDLSSYAGSSVQLRWRQGSDTSVGKEGWFVDDVRVQACTSDVIFTNGFDSVPVL
ncbi:MAG: hypothetical protein ABIR16_04255 [Dokdonella sp.]